MLLRMVDSANPPSMSELEELKAWNVDAIGGYIGGRALNVWSMENFIHCDELHFKLLPIWVGPRGGITHAQGAQEGNECLQAMQAYGLAGVVALDIEADATVSTAWLYGFLDSTRAGDLGVIVYCTPTDAGYWLGIDQLIGFWIARWNTAKLTDLVPPTVAWQYASIGRWDYSVLAEDVALATLSPSPG